MRFSNLLLVSLFVESEVRSLVCESFVITFWCPGWILKLPHLKMDFAEWTWGEVILKCAFFCNLNMLKKKEYIATAHCDPTW